MIILFILSALHTGTFSIVAMDPQTQEWGIAVASRVLDAAYIVPWLHADAGACASQAMSNPYLGQRALEELSRGLNADKVLKNILAQDTAPEIRQIGIVDRDGKSAAHTGNECLAWAGHRTAQYVSIQGNILTGPEVVDSMLFAFQNTEGILAEKLLSALEAGERAGGDKRGKQSCGLYVVRKRGGFLGVDDRLVELKVVDNEQPVQELRRQYELWQYAFVAPAYIRLSDEEEKSSAIFLDRAYQLLIKALKANLESAEVYNSLAWEFALRKKYPKDVILAAQLAHELAPDDPNIMDTLAEAFYASGQYEKAVFWEKEALKREPDSEFFKTQLKKFGNALEQSKKTDKPE